MLAEYRRLQANSILDWGREVPALTGAEYGRFLDLGLLWPLFVETGDWSEAVRRSVPDPLPRGLIVAEVSESGVELTTVEMGRINSGDEGGGRSRSGVRAVTRNYRERIQNSEVL